MGIFSRTTISTVVCTVSMAVGLGLSSSVLSPAMAAGIGGGITGGPDDSFSIDLTLFNDNLSTSDVTSINLDGSTASAFPLVWDDVFSVNRPSGSSVSILGSDTQLLSFIFASNPDGFNPGESFSFSVDPDTVDDPSAGITIGQLAGVQARFNFADSSSFLGVFVDDLTPGAGLVLRPVPVPVPEPTTITASGLALVGLAYLKGWRLKTRKASN